MPLQGPQPPGSSPTSTDPLSGLTRAQVISQIQALVSALALVGDTDTWPDNKIPASITRDTELAASIADFLTESQIRSLVGSLNPVKDRGAWAVVGEYALHDVTRHDDATYIALQDVAPNTAAVTEPGAGTGWSSYWYRVGFSDGPPNAFVNATLAGQVLTLLRESGENPLELTLPEGNSVTVPPTVAAFNPVRLTDRTYTWDGGVTQRFDILAGTSGTAQLVAPSNGFLIISIHGFGDFEGNSTWRLAADLRSATEADPLHLQPTGVPSFTPADLFTNNDNEICFHPRNAATPSSNDRITIWHVPDPADDAVDHGLARVESIRFQAIADGNSDVEAAPLATDPLSVITGSGAPQILSGISGNDFTVGAGVYLVFLDSLLTSSQNSANPVFVLRRSSDDAELFQSTSPTLRISGTYRAGLMTVAVFPSDTEVNIYIRRQSRSMSLPANWALDFIRLSGVNVPSVRPSITRFDVSGEASPAAGSIGGQVYRYDLAISQSAHVSAARIVGFAGTAQSPAGVTNLATLSEYHAASGQVAIPAGVSLAAGDIYTLRLEVYETGQTVGTDTPVAYHDYRITAHAVAQAVHFGRVLSSEDASAIVFADDDISTAGTVARTWVAQIPDDSNSYRLYWAVPASEPQPSNWSSGGISINVAVEAAVDRTIGGVSYKIYLFAAVSAVDHLYDGTSIVVTT